MKYYVITCGSYSDYHIIGVTTDETKANEYCKVYNRINVHYPWDDEAMVEIFDEFENIFLYSNRAQRLNHYCVSKTVKRYLDGKAQIITECSFSKCDLLDKTEVLSNKVHLLTNQNEFEATYNKIEYLNFMPYRPKRPEYLEYRYWTYVWAKNEEDAQKIGADRIAKKQAEVEIDGAFDAQEGKE